MSQPLVTAVVLCFNTGQWTIRTIQSILNNGYDNVEIICIDDSSSDGESQIQLQEFHRASQFGTLILNKENLGIPASANKGLSLANGKYFFIIGDDSILPGKLQGDVDLLENSTNKTAVVHSIMQFVNFDYSIKYPHFSPTFAYPQEGPDLSTFGKVLKAGGGVAAPTSVFKTEILRSINGWDETLKYEDKPMWLKLSSLGYKLHFRAVVTVEYRRNSKQVSNQFSTGDLVYQMQVFSQYSEFAEAKQQMNKILILASSAKIDKVNDLSECLRIYRLKYPNFSLIAFLAQCGLITLAARLFRVFQKSRINKG